MFDFHRNLKVFLFRSWERFFQKKWANIRLSMEMIHHRSGLGYIIVIVKTKCIYVYMQTKPFLKTRSTIKPFNFVIIFQHFIICCSVFKGEMWIYHCSLISDQCRGRGLHQFCFCFCCMSIYVFFVTFH